MNSETDCLIIGTGLAGCTAALKAADAGLKVTLVTRTSAPEDTATARAQGGIVFRSPKENGDEPLVHDIMSAGAQLSYRAAVEQLAQEGPKRVQELLIDRLHIQFNRDKDGSFNFTEEAAHSVARILHCDDRTGVSIERAFLNELAKHKNVAILTEQTAVDLLTLSHHSSDPQDFYEPPRCIGSYILDQKSGKVTAVLAKETVLATGGLGQLYLHTTNPPGARGDGLAMAYRTGARIMNLEYMQFHPTALYKKGANRFLITEAVRGEGGKLLNDAGEAFMQRYDSRGDLAPRDVVSRAIHDELLKRGSPSVFLDISHKPADWIRSRFPNVHAECLKEGIDMTKESIPVVPAAHYACGGVWVDLDGKTSIRNLYAVGEVSCTGVHGANRLASTSLLEDLVWGHRAGERISKSVKSEKFQFPTVHPWHAEGEPTDPDLLVQDWMTVKHTMWNYVGLVRTSRRLERAQRILRELSDEVQKFYAKAKLSDELVGLRNGVTAAQLILIAATRNRQSVGCHFLRSEE